MFNEDGELKLGNIQNLWIYMDIKGSFVNVEQKFNYTYNLSSIKDLIFWYIHWIPKY